MKTFVILPTYNERENIEGMIQQILSVCPTCEVLVVDDDSPDGTWRIVKELSCQDARVHLLHRTTNRGRGIACIAGLLYALSHNADIVIEMDADFSHNPSYIPVFLNAAEDFDIVLGSRFVQGGADSDRGWVRRLITLLANIYVRILFGIRLHDCSSGFRCFRREVLENTGLENMTATGPEILQEMLFRSCQLGHRILEIPIVFHDRKRGKTKLKYRQLLRGFMMVLRLRFSKPPVGQKKSRSLVV